MVSTNETLVTVGRAAQICLVSKQTVYRWMRDGKLESARLGGAKRTSREAIDRFMRHGGQAEDRSRRDAVLEDLERRFGIVIGKEERRGRKETEVLGLREGQGDSRKGKLQRLPQ